MTSPLPQPSLSCLHQCPHSYLQLDPPGISSSVTLDTSYGFSFQIEEKKSHSIKLYPLEIPVQQDGSGSYCLPEDHQKPEEFTTLVNIIIKI